MRNFCTIRDQDKIGKDEFMGEVIIAVKSLQQDEGLYQGNSQEMIVPLAQRAGSTSKSVVGGTLTFGYSFLSDKKKLELESNSSDEFEEKRRALEREAQQRRAAAQEAKQRRQDRIDTLVGEFTTEMDVDLQTVEEAARLVAGRGGTNIENKTALRSILTQLGAWDAVRRYAFWANTQILGESAAAQDLSLKAAIDGDKGVADAEMDRAWRTSLWDCFPSLFD